MEQRPGISIVQTHSLVHSVTTKSSRNAQAQALDSLLLLDDKRKQQLGNSRGCRGSIRPQNCRLQTYHSVVQADHASHESQVYLHLYMASIPGWARIKHKHKHQKSEAKQKSSTATCKEASAAAACVSAFIGSSGISGGDADPSVSPGRLTGAGVCSKLL